jgi:hypothetical protein
LEDEWGASPAQLESIRAAADDDSDTVYLWPENRTAFDVFVQCKWQVQLTPEGRKFFMGITAQELQAACWLLSVAEGERAAVVAGVRICEGAALPHLNKAR